MVGTLEKEKAGALGIGGVMKTFDYKAKEFIFCLENHLKLEYGGIKRPCLCCRKINSAAVCLMAIRSSKSGSQEPGGKLWSQFRPELMP